MRRRHPHPLPSGRLRTGWIRRVSDFRQFLHCRQILYTFLTNWRCRLLKQAQNKDICKYFFCYRICSFWRNKDFQNFKVAFSICIIKQSFGTRVTRPACRLLHADMLFVHISLLAGLLLTLHCLAGSVFAAWSRHSKHGLGHFFLRDERLDVELRAVVRRTHRVYRRRGKTAAIHIDRTRNTKMNDHFYLSPCGKACHSSTYFM